MAKKKTTQKQCLEKMRERYGTESNWAEVQVYLTAHEMDEFFGPMCEEYEPLCPACRAWFQWNTTGKVTVDLERQDVLKILRS